MDRNKAGDMRHHKGHPGMNTPPIVSPQEWKVAREQLLVKEKALTRASDALAAERRRMPWMAVEKAYEFEGPAGKVSLLSGGCRTGYVRPGARGARGNRGNATD